MGLSDGFLRQQLGALDAQQSAIGMQGAVERLGYDGVRLLVYRCAYSLIIANAHEDDPYGRDSHVPLTARFFNTPQVSALLS